MQPINLGKEIVETNLPLKYQESMCVFKFGDKFSR